VVVPTEVTMLEVVNDVAWDPPEYVPPVVNPLNVLPFVTDPPV
jgi:hypothetical protein